MTGCQMSTCEKSIKHDIGDGASGQHWSVLNAHV